MTNKRIITWIKAKDYDKINNYNEVEITVEAKNRPCMNVFVNKYPEDKLIRDITIAETKQHGGCLIKIGCIVQQMKTQNMINVSDDEALTDFAVELINKCIARRPIDTTFNFDSFVEKALLEKYGVKENQND